MFLTFECYLLSENVEREKWKNYEAIITFSELQIPTTQHTKTKLIC